MKLLLVDPNEGMCAAWREEFGDAASVHCGRFEDVTADFTAVIAPGNSFGLMDGGFDLALLGKYGKRLQDHVRHRILTEFCGEQPVGTATVLSSGDPAHPYVIYAPTMRVPMDIRGTDAVYRAFRAAIMASNVRGHLEVLSPGMGTGHGCMSFKASAKQMHVAYKAAVRPIKALDWAEAKKRQLLIDSTNKQGEEK